MSRLGDLRFMARVAVLVACAYAICAYFVYRAQDSNLSAWKDRWYAATGKWREQADYKDSSFVDSQGRDVSDFDEAFERDDPRPPRPGYLFLEVAAGLTILLVVTWAVASLRSIDLSNDQ